MLLNGYPVDYHGNQFTWWTGRVEAVYEPELNDPEAVNRVRVRIFGYQDMDFPVEDLPLCTVIMPPTVGYGPGGAGQTHGLLKEDLVIGFFMDHDQQMPVVTGVIMGKAKEEDELLGSPGGTSAPTVTKANATTSTTAANQTASPPTPAARPDAPSSAPTEPAPTPAARPEAPDHTPLEDVTPETVVQRDDGVEFNDTGVEGGTGDKSIPATLRHNNPLGNNMSGLANRFDPLGAGQNLDGVNTIASFADTSDGYGYSYAQMALNAERAGMYEGGRLYTTPQFMGDGHYTAGYNGDTIVGAVGNNDRLYFDTWSPGWYSATEAMQIRETGSGLRNKARGRNNLPSGYDFGQNSTQAERGFNKMKKYKGF